MPVESRCLSYSYSLPGESPASNIIADIGINIAFPNSYIKWRKGESFEILEENIPEIRNKVTSLVENVDLSAVQIYKWTTNTLYISSILLLLTIITTIISQNNILSYISVLFFFIEFVYVIFYTFFIRMFCKNWGKQVLRVLLNYVKNEFRNTYLQNSHIHVLYPIEEYGNGGRILANWIIIRITNGAIKKPTNGPVYWSSNSMGSNIPPPIDVLVEQSEENQEGEPDLDDTIEEKN